LHTKKRFRQGLTLLGLSISLILTILFATTVGSVNIPPLTVLKILFCPIFSSRSWSHVDEVIILDVRLPRVLLSALVGSALAVAGTTIQALFRNPMASPFTLGISSGAAFGASLAIVFGVGLAAGTYAVSLMAFLFALLTVFLVYGIAKVGKRTPMETLLLTGIAVGSLFSALVSFMLYVAGEKLSTIVFWLMGGFWASDWNKVLLTSPLILLGIATIFLFGRHLNLILMGEETAINLGLEVEIFRKIVLIFASLITAAAVSVCGTIGFVGLIIPHVVRILVGPDHRVLLPSSCLFGAIFLVWVDALARTIIKPIELPVGIITALLGVPFFLYLLHKRKRVMGW
jgi:iron complex transport system permease protein